MRTLLVALAGLALSIPFAASQAQAGGPSNRGAKPDSVHADSAAVDGEVSDMYVRGDSLEVVFANTGRVRAAIEGKVAVLAPDDSVVFTVRLADATVPAGETRRLRVAMPKLAKGKYTLYAVVDFGGPQLTAAQAALEIR